MNRFIAPSLAAAIAMFFANATFAQSPAPDPDQLIKALTEKGATRGLSPGSEGADSADIQKRRQIIEALQSREKSRGLSVKEHGQSAYVAPKPTSPVSAPVTTKDVQAATAGRPKIDIEIFFDYNSAAIAEQAKPAIAALAKSLTSDQLKGQTFLLAGHTDAKGGDEYNKALSERRAQSVKDYLVGQYGIPEKELAIIGYGEEQLKVPSEPYSSKNRRVEVVNMGQVAMELTGQSR